MSDARTRARPNGGPPTDAGEGAEYPWDRPLGARVLEDGGAQFRVWAPRAQAVAVRLGGDRDVPLDAVGYDVYEAVVDDAGSGEDYQFVLDGGEAYPDPCTRWQPEGLRGPSRVVELQAPVAPLGDAPGLDQHVIYELHVGTFTREGTFAAAARELPALAQLGISAIEIMPVAEFPGRHGWGYDGVYLSSAQSSYGGPHELAELVRAAHEAGLAVILDVVYNHVGASGTPALDAFGPYFTEKYETPWGRAVNYDDADCDGVREWVIQSAEGWVRDFGIDGLRLDAIWSIFDSSPEHIVAAVARRVHDINPSALVIAESGLNDPKVMRPRERGGYACDATWADDFHHSLRTLVTDEHDGYYAEFGRMADLAKAFHRPHVHDGEYSSFRRRRFGAPADDIPPEQFVVFSQDHDQVGNRAYGDRMPAQARPLAALCTLLSPFTPMLFMGEEYGEEAPFQFFSDHIDADIADATRDGRRREFASFAQFGGEIPDPQDVATFERSKLTRRGDPAIQRLYVDLLATRRRMGGAGEPELVDFDEEARWLHVRRGGVDVVCNFASEPRQVPCQGRTVALATATAEVGEGHVTLPPLSGAVIA